MTSNTNLSTQRQSASPKAVRSVSSFRRPGNTTAYAVGDAVFDETSPGVIQFDSVGGSGLVKNAHMIMGETDTASFVLLLFDREPTNVGDNLASAFDVEDMEKLVGMVTFLNAGKTNLGTNVEYYVADEAHLDFAYTSDSGKLYGVLLTNSVWTPSANTWFELSLSCEVEE